MEGKHTSGKNESTIRRSKGLPASTASTATAYARVMSSGASGAMPNEATRWRRTPRVEA